MISFGLDWEKNTSYGQKHFRETNNRLCKVSFAETTRKRNDRLRDSRIQSKSNSDQTLMSYVLFNEIGNKLNKNKVLRYFFVTRKNHSSWKSISPNFLWTWHCTISVAMSIRVSLADFTILETKHDNHAVCSLQMEIRRSLSLYETKMHLIYINRSSYQLLSNSPGLENLLARLCPWTYCVCNSSWTHTKKRASNFKILISKILKRFCRINLILLSWNLFVGHFSNFVETKDSRVHFSPCPFLNTVRN